MTSSVLPHSAGAMDGGKRKWTHPLGLNKHEYSVLLQAHWAISQVENRYFLPAIGRRKAAEKLIERGFLTEADWLMPTGWLVVKVTDENIATYNAALKLVEGGS